MLDADAASEGAPMLDADAASEGAPMLDADAAPEAAPMLDFESHMRLWLRADDGVVCSLGRVTRWIDWSGGRNDATLKLGQLGPECNLSPSPHRINGIDVPYFSAPNRGTSVIDESLDVDLTFLNNSSYTIFVVDRRSDNPSSSSVPEYVVGTTLPPEDDPTPDCAHIPFNQLLTLGYTNPRGAVQLTLDHGCAPLVYTLGGPVLTVGVASLTTAMFGKTAGREMWINGTAVVQDLDLSPLTNLHGGAIGRAVTTTTQSGSDGRFRGDIAEIRIYDGALNDGERSVIEAGLMSQWGIAP
jgi:hypothetical protein